MPSALFSVNADLTDQGFQATNSQVLTLRLKQQPPIGVNTVLFQVFSVAAFDPTLAIAANPPRCSLNAPALTIVGATSGATASPATVDGTVTITMPATGAHSYIVRCVVNGGLRSLPNGSSIVDPTLIHERGIFTPTGVGLRKVVCTEVRQFSNGGWADALGDLPDYIIPDGSIAYVKLTGTAAGLRGSGLTVDSANRLTLRTRPRRFVMQDWFVSGGTTSGTIGSHAWNLFGTGTPQIIRSATNLGGATKLQFSASAATNDRSVLCWGNTEAAGRATASELGIMQTLWTFSSQQGGKRIFFGMMSDFSQEPSAATDCLGIYYDNAVSPNYQIIARAAGVGVPLVTAAVAPLNTAELVSIVQSVTGTFDFRIGSTLIGSRSSGIPGAIMNVGYRLQNIAVTQRDHRIGYFGFAYDDLGGAADDDGFLEA